MLVVNKVCRSTFTLINNTMQNVEQNMRARYLYQETG